MKTKIAMLLALVMLYACTAASAQEYYTLPEIREQAAAGWHETYTDKYGRETTVDIDVEVFGEKTAPIIKLTIPYGENDHLRQYENAPYDTVLNIKRFGAKQFHVWRSFGKLIDTDQAYGNEYGNDLTYGELTEYLDEKLKQNGFSSTGFFVDCPDYVDVLCALKDTSGEIHATSFYDVRLWQQFNGLPLLTHVHESYKKGTGPSFVPRLDFQMRNRDEYYLSCFYMEESEEVVEDIPLCSFDLVIEGLEEEIKRGYIQRVESLRFGYAIYNDPKNPKGTRSAYDAEYYYAVPAWVVECVYMTSPKESYIPEYEKLLEREADGTIRQIVGFKEITIDAQTGKMFNPMDKSKNGGGDTNYKGFIPWDKVQ